VCVNMPWAMSAIAVLPFSLLADRIGKKRVGIPGVIMSATGFGLLATIPWMPQPLQEFGALGGTAIYGLGATAMESSWFALLMPIVPDPMRGRFFGYLRTSWQLAGIIVINGCGWYLGNNPLVRDFQLVVLLIALLMTVRIWFYSRIPDLEPNPTLRGSVLKALGTIVRLPGYTSFCAYVFLLHLCISGVLAQFVLIERDVLHMGENQIVWTSGFHMVGLLIGFWFGGKAVDRYTTKPVFLVCHFGFGLVLVLFVLRGLIPISTMALLGALNLVFGLVLAGSGIAITTETLALIPAENKSLSTSSCRMLTRLGGALSGMLAAWVLKQEMLAPEWTLWGQTMSPYDTILLMTAVMVVLLVVTLGLVPSVIRKAEWLPGR